MMQRLKDLFSQGKMWLWIFLSLFLFVCIGLVVSVYAFPANSFSQKVSTAISLPVVFLTPQQFITSREWEKNTLSTIRLYTEKKDILLKAGLSIDFSGADGQKLLLVKRKEILNKMLEDRFIEKLSTERGLSVSAADLTNNVDVVLQKNGNDEKFRQQLSIDYGWTLDDFKQIVVRPTLLNDALEKSFNQQKQDNGKAKQTMLEAQRQLSGGMSFADVANHYSEGATANNSGDLGWLPIEAVTPEIATFVKDQPLHVATGIIESALGFHIVVVDDRQEKNNSILVHLRQIFVHKQTYAEWLQEQKRQIRPLILLRGYQWNADAGRIEFSDPDMRHFEENVRQEASGMIL